jgi:hypothetical protein
MNIKELIDELEHQREKHGENTPVHFQVSKSDLLEADAEGSKITIVGFEEFFVVDENYSGETIINLRTWPY